MEEIEVCLEMKAKGLRFMITKDRKEKKK